MRRGSWVRAVLFLADTHQPAAPAATSTMITNTVEVQYNQAGPTGCPHAAEGFPPCWAKARTPAPRLTAGTAFPDRTAVIAAPAQRTREPKTPTNTAASSSVSVELGPPGRPDEGDMPRLARNRVHHACGSWCHGPQLPWSSRMLNVSVTGLRPMTAGHEFCGYGRPVRPRVRRRR